MYISERPRVGRVARSLAVVLVAFLSLAAISCSDPEKAKAEHVRRGEAFLKDRKYHEAALEFRNAIQIDDNLAAAHWGLAQAYEKLERFNEAFDELTRAVELDPANKEARFKLGTYSLMGSHRNGQIVNHELLDNAQRHAEELINQDANYINGHVLLANVLVVRGERAKALERLNHAIQLDPNRVETRISLATFYWTTGDAAKAEQTFKEAIGMNEAASAARVEFGRFLVQQKRLDEAEAQFRRAIEVDPLNHDVHWVLASFYLVNNRLDKAEEAYKALAELDSGRPEGRAKLADFYAMVGRLDEALHLYQENAKQFPDYARGHFRIGELLLQRGDVGGAGAKAEEILKKNGRDMDALLLRARTRLAQSQIKEAVADLRQVLEQEPRSLMALYFLSEAQFNDGRVEEARSAAGELERFHPNFLPARLMHLQINLAGGDAEQARRQATDLLEKVSQTAPSSLQTPQLLTEVKVRTLIARGTAYMRLRDAAKSQGEAAQMIEAARADLQAARDIWPNTPASYVNLGTLALAEGKTDEAMQQFEQALRIDRTDYSALNGVLTTYARLEQPEQARARMDALLGEFSDKATLHYLKGVAYRMATRDGRVQPDTPTVEASLRRAVELDPNLVDAHWLLAEHYYAMGQIDAAVEQCRQIIERRPNNTAAYIYIADLESKRKNYDAAVEQYRRALEVNPEADIAANNLAMLYVEHEKGNADEALRLAQEAVRRQPAHPSYVDTLGWVYYKKGLHDAAAEQFRKALSLLAARQGDSSLYRYHLGLALIGKGDRSAARRELQIALRVAETEAQREQRPGAHIEDARRTLESL